MQKTSMIETPKIEVFSLSKLEEITDVLARGLKSRERLIDEGKLPDEKLMHEFERWGRRIIYFCLEEPNNSTPWVSILVDPTATFVGNGALKLSYDAYRLSIMSLSGYFRRQKKGRGEFSNPITAERMRRAKIMTFEDTYNTLRGDKQEFEVNGIYMPEVFIETGRIGKFHRVFDGRRHT
jgi:hypothetical protein